MNRFTKKDLKFALITGLMTGILGWRIFEFLGSSLLFGIPGIVFIFVVPILWIVGVNLGYFLGKFIPFFNQFGKFVAVGFTNAAVDFGVLNLQIGQTGIESGWHYALFKSVSFVIGVSNSYIFNKYWVFEAGSSGGGRSEMIRFLGVNIVAMVFNVGVASFVVNYVHPVYGLDGKLWANIGAVVGSACAIFLTFIGSRLIVFKKSNNVVSQIPPSDF